MPLVACPDCATEISDQAPACVRCGRPMVRAVPVAATSSIAGPGGGGNVLAAFASLLVPGLGQLLQGRVGMGIGGLLAIPVVWSIALFAGVPLAAKLPGAFALLGFLLMVGPVAYHLVAAVDAAQWDGKKD